MRLRYVLPAVQIIVAFAAYYESYRWFEWRRHFFHDDMPGTWPGFTLLVSLNAPVAFVRLFYYRHLSDFWEEAVFILSIGLLWYWVARNIECWHSTRRVFSFPQKIPRMLFDALLSLLGLLFVVYAREVYWHLGPSVQLSLYYWPSFFFFLGWSAALIFFFGRDFILCIRSSR
jgi:hypothetical protein